MKQRYSKRQPKDANSVQYFVSQGIPQNFAEAMSARGISQADFCYYSGTDCFHSPFEMKNMREAAETVKYLMESGGSVLICGDYDADGLTASSILSLFFSDNGVDNDVLIPTREMGYGLHVETVLEAFSKKFYDLIITVDCGISNKAEVEKIQEELGVEIIVTDHHELPEQLPPCLCVDPKMGYPFADLAGAGVAWKLVEALVGRQVAANYSALAMIGTIGDVMPMTDENRSIVKLGLANFNHKSLQKLADTSFCSKQISATDISMKIVPRINAAGRMGNPNVALKVLLSRDKVSPYIEKLAELNELRKVAIASLMEDADKLCDGEQIRNDKLVFLEKDNWPHGILGIAAARYKDKYGFPAVILTKDAEKGVYVGSARGTDDFDLFVAVSKCKDLLAQFGGHKAALGFSVTAENLQPFKNRLVSVLAEADKECFERKFWYDIDLENGCNLADIYALTQRLEPLLPQDKMLFRVKDTVKAASVFGKDKNCLSVVLSGGLELKCICNRAEYAPIINRGADVEGIISLEYDERNQRVCGVAKDLRLLNSVCFDGFYKQNLFKNLAPNNDENFLTNEQVVEILAQSSVLAVFDDYETYLAQSENFDFSDFDEDIFFANSYSEKTVVISPVDDYDFSKYKFVVSFCKQGYVRKLPNAKYFCVTPANEMLYSLHLNRNICAAVYKQLKHKNPYDSLRTVYDKFLASTMDYAQFLVVLRVLEELRLVEIADKFTVNLLPSDKVELNNSAIFRALAE